MISAIQRETRSAVDDMHRIVGEVTANADSARQAGELIILFSSVEDFQVVPGRGLMGVCGE